MNEKYKIKGGQKEFEDYFNVARIAKAKAQNEKTEVVVCKKTLNTLEPVARFTPSGKEERLDYLPTTVFDSPTPTTPFFTLPSSM